MHATAPNRATPIMIVAAPTTSPTRSVQPGHTPPAHLTHHPPLSFCSRCPWSALSALCDAPRWRCWCWMHQRASPSRTSASPSTS